MKKSKERYEDYKSTAFLFVPFGILGIIYIVVDYFDIWKKANFITSLFQFIVAAVMFVIFILIGISSYITAKSILKEIPLEDDITEKINSYLASNLTQNYIDSMMKAELSSNDAETYYTVVNSMSEQVKAEFSDASEELVTELVENYYNDNF